MTNKQVKNLKYGDVILNESGQKMVYAGSSKYGNTMKFKDHIDSEACDPQAISSWTINRSYVKHNFELIK